MLKASDIPIRRNPTDEDARATIEETLQDERRMPELPAALILYEWYRQQEEDDAEFTIRYALTVTLRFLQHTRLYQHQRKKDQR